ncbi:MAG: hypothetical protein K2X94_03965 [Amoebophilaceae bacterium]|nr:hypothetical protein [Amoebophilaceae bacterium]
MIKNLNKILILCLSLGAAVCTKSKVPKIYPHQVTPLEQLSTTDTIAPPIPILAVSNVCQPQDSKPPYPPSGGGSCSAPSQPPAALPDKEPLKPLPPAPKDPPKNPDPDDDPNKGGGKPPVASAAVEQAKKQYEGFILCIDKIKAREQAVDLAQLQDQKAIKVEIAAIEPALLQAVKLVTELATLVHEATTHNAPDVQPLEAYLKLTQQALAELNNFKQKLVAKKKELKEKNRTKFSNLFIKPKPKDEPPVDTNNNANTQSSGIVKGVDPQEGAGGNTVHTKELPQSLLKQEKKKGFKHKLAKLGKKMLAKLAHKKSKPTISFQYEHELDAILEPIDEVDVFYRPKVGIASRPIYEADSVCHTTAALTELVERISEVIENFSPEELDEERLAHVIDEIERKFDQLEQADLDDEGYNQLETLAQKLQLLEEALDL